MGKKNIKKYNDKNWVKIKKKYNFTKLAVSVVERTERLIETYVWANFRMTTLSFCLSAAFMWEPCIYMSVFVTLLTIESDTEDGICKCICNISTCQVEQGGSIWMKVNIWSFKLFLEFLIIVSASYGLIVQSTHEYLSKFLLSL